MKEKFKKGKITILPILALLIITLLGINNVQAKIITHYSCPSGKYQVSGTKKCCAKFDGVKATSISSDNNCQYPQKSVSSSHSHKGGTYNGVSCPLIGKYCSGGYPSDMITSTGIYSTTVYFKDYYGNIIGNVASPNNQATVSKWFANACPSGYTFNNWDKESGPIISTNGTSVTFYTYDYNTNAYVKASCTYNKIYYGPTGGSGTVSSTVQTPDPEDNACKKSENTKKIVNINNHKITYKLDGGHFLDGSTSREELIKDNVEVGGLSLNPLKEGYKFVSWQKDGKDFDFNTKISSDIILTATYEKISDEFKDAYSCPEGYVLDPSNAKCYKLLDFNSTKYNNSLSGIYYVPYKSTATPTLGTAYNYTTYTYNDGIRMCYGYNAPSNGDPGSIALTDGEDTSLTEGKNDATYYFLDGNDYVKYEEQDWWKSEDTCNFGSKCELDECTKVSGSCKITYSAIIFHSISATSNLKDLEEPEEIYDVNDNDPTDTLPDKEDINLSDNDITTNPKTGGSIWLIIAFAAFFIGLGVYSHHNYQNTNEKEEQH